MIKLGLVLLLFCPSLFAIDIDGAISLGSKYKTQEKYAKDCLGVNTICHGQACYLFYSDFEIIAGAAARANQELRPFTREDAEKLNLSGLTHIYVTVSNNNGVIGEELYARHWAGGNIHMVIQSGGKLIQPVEKGNGSFSSLLFLLGYAETSLENSFDFAFNLSQEQLFSPGETILIDAQAKKHIEKASFADILHLRPYEAKDPQLFMFKDGTSMCLDLVKTTEEYYRLKDHRGISHDIPLKQVKTVIIDRNKPCSLGYQ
jgi:hypothetical protein